MSGPISSAHNNLEASYSPTIYNVTLTNAGTEYSQVLPTGVRKFSIRPRVLSNSIKFSFTSGQSGTVFATADSLTYSEDLIGADSLTLYMQSATAGAVVEIVAWS